ncbi:BEN domain-containing protein 5-like [Pseudoliparis swirei]|uniref:BEN domain-containing protein 5-like n=1 Tax=Pseudoliparis swirei TaxID=2059687 RepID=UPI0024BE018C|nr:BEN domain-containing protein 5-like [Pseudoliparis swirei]
MCPTPLKKVRERILSDSFSEEDGDDNDDGGVVPETLLKEAKQTQQLYQNKFKEMSLQLQDTRKQLEDQKKRRVAVEAENKTLRGLNIELQQQLLKKLKTTSTPIETGCESAEEPSVSPYGDKISLEGDINIRKETWVRINRNNRDSLFVKELAVAIWGTKTLGEKSLTGKECPTTKTTRQPLTPKKLQTLKVCFKEWLQKKTLEETELQARWAKAGRYITEKIMDINKKNKKNLINE